MTVRTTKNVAVASAITHGGVFHSDEVLATVILNKLFGDITVYRTFKLPEEVAEDVIVYDIGLGQFDHHQQGGNGSRENGVPYAAVGLIWKEYGYQLVKDTPNPELVWSIIDQELIQGVDASDNGDMPMADYPAQVMSFPKQIVGFNPTWDSSEDPDEAFLRAVAFAEIVFDNALASAISRAKAQGIVEEAITNAEGQIMVLDQFVPWQEFVLTSTNPKADGILFAVYPSIRGGYNWQCVPDAVGSFGNRKSVPDDWKGLRDAELQEKTGAATATFCHPAGFIGGTETLEDAIAIARVAVQS